MLLGCCIKLLCNMATSYGQILKLGIFCPKTGMGRVCPILTELVWYLTIFGPNIPSLFDFCDFFTTSLILIFCYRLSIQDHGP
jgi:hypothetical protein